MQAGSRSSDSRERRTRAPQGRVRKIIRTRPTRAFWEQGCFACPFLPATSDDGPEDPLHESWDTHPRTAAVCLGERVGVRDLAAFPCRASVPDARGLRIDGYCGDAARIERRQARNT